MTSYNISLSSNPSSENVYLSNFTLSDVSNVSFSLSAVDRSRIPISLKIRWGDSSSDEYHVNNFFIDYSKQSILDQILYSVNYTLLTDYSHIYKPSSSTLTTYLSCQFLVTYQDNSKCRFIQPLTIYSPSFYSKIGDLNIVNTSFISVDKSLLHTFITENGSITDLVFDTERSIAN